MKVPYRIGYGFDVHRWQESRRLVLGGVEIPHHQGLLGHSDADALTHAIIDAILGALALGDIGQHFPDTDPRYKDACSLDLLRKTMTFVQNSDFQVANIDSTIVTDAPKMAPHISGIRENLAAAVNVDDSCISVKATRTEGIIFPHEGGLLALAMVLLIHKET